MLNIAVLQADLKTKQAAALSLYEKHAKTAETENRATTDAERAEVKALVDEAEGIKAQLARAAGDTEQLQAIQRLTNGVGLTPISAPAHAARMTMGQQFIKAAEYDFFRKGLHRVQSAWRSPSVELFDMMRAATLTEDPASGGALVMPQYVPGILPLPQRPLVVADLFAQGTSTSNAISYMREKTFVNNAAAVLEGGVKPESALTFEAATDPVRKIAHWLPVTEEMLEDVDQIQSYIDARLRLGVQLKEDDELLNGDGVAPNLDGILHRATGPTVGPPVAPATVADAIFQQIMALAATSYLMPDGVVMNPADWSKIAISKTTTGEYLAGGPFSSIPTPTIWGLRIAVTPAIAAGTALVGAFQTGAQIFRKGGIRVEASNSHVDFFIKNLVAIRAEERLALAVYRPAAFGKVTTA
jgi:HK97 family phage major capsid protein